MESMKPLRRVKVVFWKAEYELKRLKEAVDRLNEISLPYEELPINVVIPSEVRNKLIVGLSEVRDDYKRFSDRSS